MSWRIRTSLVLGAALALTLMVGTTNADWWWQVDRKSAWQEPLTQQLREIEADFHGESGVPGELGVYVQDLHSGEDFSWRAEEWWYLASLVKVPIAVEVFSLIDDEELTLDDEMTLTRADYVDGAGRSNWQEPGSRLTIGFLLEEMLTVSDNTASDMLIRRVGLSAINRRVRDMVAAAGVAPSEVGPITTLLDVRRHAFAELHPRAFELGGLDFIELRRAGVLSARVAAFRERLGLSVDDLSLTDYDSAFAAYYDTERNGGTLRAYGALLATLARDDEAGLSEASREALLETMHRTTSGERRLKAGWSGDVRFSHKTGTQHRRLCDAGIVSRGEVGEQRDWVVVVCSRGPLAVAPHEAALAKVGAAIEGAGVLSLPSR